MATFDWRPFLEQFSRELLADRDIRREVPEAVRQSSWMGFKPATKKQIATLEARIGAKLPDSYREFLTTSNGWRQTGSFIYEVWPTTKVDWFRNYHRDWVDAWVEPTKGQPPLPIEEHCVYGEHQSTVVFRVEFLESTLQMSDIGDAAVLLLNPEIKTPAGEWEAWFFASWHPGAVRYQSFWDLMQHEYQSFITLRDHSEKAYFPEDGIDTLPPKVPGLIQELASKAQDWRSLLDKKKAKGSSKLGLRDEGIAEALEAAESKVREIAALGLRPDALLAQLTGLASELEHQWRIGADNYRCGLDKDDGRAEGNREATGIIRWFLSQRQA
jgi:SMI1 / KNR4 family (SUKH-1)